MSEAWRKRRGCHSRILKMLERKNLTLEELKEEHDQKRIHLFKGHIKEMSRMIDEEKDKRVLTEDNQRQPSFYRRIIKRTINREGCSLKEFGQRDLNKNARLELDKMIYEEEQNKKQEEKMVSTSTKPLVVACRLTDHITHLVNVGLNVHEEPLSLSNRALCGQLLTRDSILKFCNEATCPVCLREDAKRNNQEKQATTQTRG